MWQLWQSTFERTIFLFRLLSCSYYSSSPCLSIGVCVGGGGGYEYVSAIEDERLCRCIHIYVFLWISMQDLECYVWRKGMCMCVYVDI